MRASQSSWPVSFMCSAMVSAISASEGRGCFSVLATDNIVLAGIGTSGTLSDQESQHCAASAIVGNWTGKFDGMWVRMEIVPLGGRRFGMRGPSNSRYSPCGQNCDRVNLIQRHPSTSAPCAPTAAWSSIAPSRIGAISHSPLDSLGIVQPSSSTRRWWYSPPGSLHSSPQRSMHRRISTVLSLR